MNPSRRRMTVFIGCNYKQTSGLLEEIRDEPAASEDGIQRP